MTTTIPMHRPDNPPLRRRSPRESNRVAEWKAKKAEWRRQQAEAMMNIAAPEDDEDVLPQPSVVERNEDRAWWFVLALIAAAVVIGGVIATW